MKGATLKQAAKILALFDETPLEQVQAILSSGFLSDLRDANIAEVNREDLRRVLRLKSLEQMHFKKERRIELLRLISGGENIVIGPTDGTGILAKAIDVFGYAQVAEDFVDKKIGGLDPATPETSVQVYELIRRASFQDMFGSFSRDLNSLCLTRNQVIFFARNCRNWIGPKGCATFFLLKRHGYFVVANVNVGLRKFLDLDMHKFLLSNTWDFRQRHRIVVPVIQK